MQAGVAIDCSVRHARASNRAGATPRVAGMCYSLKCTHRTRVCAYTCCSRSGGSMGMGSYATWSDMQYCSCTQHGCSQSEKV
eukprot:364480-Chlamydomonas_euryale.AAC.6